MRKVKEWAGKTDDAMPPPLVRLRIFESTDGHCHICTRKILVGEKWEADHVEEIADGGENRESNMKPAHDWCHGVKSSENHSKRAEGKRHRAKQAGIKRQSRNSFPTNKDGKWKKKVSGEVVER